MSFLEFVNLCSDEETEVENEKEVRAAFTTNFLQEEPSFIAPNYHMEFEYTIQRGYEECGSLLGNPNSCWITDQRHIYANHNQYTYQHTLPGDQHTLPCSTPICRQFWKAGDFEAELPIGQLSQNRQNRLRVHPKFLHSNATSHKWAFGAIAELLDNAIDEVQNGATFVAVDKITNPRDGNPALLIHDDGGGMDPESLRHCMSFGFSIKQSDSSIGQYGNGFKTSTMRLGADVIVFSRCMGKRNITQSVGLLSYTFLRQMGYEDIIVPMVDYEVDPVTGVHKQLLRYGQKQFCSNLSTLLQWSPFATEADLLNQFNVLGDHGTKVIVFNLWFNDDGDMELDFDTLPEDIMISGSLKVERTKSNIKMLSQNHIAKRLRYSLRVYSSILYLHLPETFSIILRGQVVEPHHIVNDLKFVECIKYRPQIEGSIEPTIITTIGFLKDAPHVHYHGFNVYHKNRLILPFWPVIDSGNGKCKGVAGVLEVNIIRPTHNKQDFEKSILYQRLESRLKDMAIEYWNYHCQLVGYSNRRTLPSTATLPQLPDGFQTVNLSPQQLRSPSDLRSSSVNTSNIEVSRASTPSAHLQLQEGNLHHSAGRQVLNSLNAQTCSTPGQSTAISQTELPRKRRHGNSDATRSLKKASADGEITSGLKSNQKDEIEHRVEGRGTQKLITMVRENKKLQTQCLEHEKEQKQLLAKVQTLRNELLLVELSCESLQAELNLLNETKVEK